MHSPDVVHSLDYPSIAPNRLVAFTLTYINYGFAQSDASESELEENAFSFLFKYQKSTLKAICPNSNSNAIYLIPTCKFLFCFYYQSRISSCSCTSNGPKENGNQTYDNSHWSRKLFSFIQIEKVIYQSSLL